MAKQLFNTQRKLLLFKDQQTWIKRESGLFEVTMGAYDGMEVWELVGNYLLYDLSKLHKKKDIGFYRGHGMAGFKNKSWPESQKIQKINSSYILGKWVENYHPV